MSDNPKSKLRKQAKEVNGLLHAFVFKLMVEYPDLQLSITGSIQLNSVEIRLDKLIAKKILNKRQFEEWRLLTT